MENDFGPFYYGKWHRQTEREKIVEGLIVEYDKRCDDFDAIVCTEKDRYGNQMPINSDQAVMINKNARSVLMELSQRSGVSQEEIKERMEILLKEGRR